IGTGACTAGTDTADCRPAVAAGGGGQTTVASCQGAFGAYGTPDGTVTCSCDASALTGTIWGTLTYTDDSSICAAALHAGAVGPQGGTVTAQGAAGCDSYTASTQNAVTSSEFGPWSNSFYFPAISDGACPVTAPTGKPRAAIDPAPVPADSLARF